MEAEVRYYYNFYLSHAAMSFDDYQLSQDVSKIFPGVSLTPEWIRQCDRRSQIAAARLVLSKLRASVTHARSFDTSVWTMLWTISDVYVQRFGLAYADLGTSEGEIETLSRQYLLSECQSRIQTLKASPRPSATPGSKGLFYVIDAMLKGIALPTNEFAEAWQTQFSVTGAHRAYGRTTQGHPITLESVGLTKWEWRLLEAEIFPNGKPKTTAPRVREQDPTAPAVVGRDGTRDIPSTQPVPIAARAPFTARWQEVLEELIAPLFSAPQSVFQPC